MQDEPPTVRKFTDAEFAEAAKRMKSARFARLPARGGRVAALQKLHEKLADDAALYESRDLQDQRDAVAHAMHSVIDYLMAQGFAGRTVAPLMRPVKALAERENNSLDLMFTQRARPGRPRATLADHQRTGILAAFADEWLRLTASDDPSQSDKLADAARNLKGRWFGNVSRAQLQTAREFVNQEAKDHPAVAAARNFGGWLANAAEMFGSANSIPVMVRMLNDLELPFGQGEGGISKTPHVSPTG